jgi:tRNA (mo5U34)-methyltransferase
MHALMNLLTRLRRRGAAPTAPIPASGFTENRVVTPGIEAMPDAELAELNALLPWRAFTVDSKGRRFGNMAWSGKRESPQPVPDPRIAMLDGRIGLAGKHVLEVGCFEGIHTAALCLRAACVTAVDARVDNIAKTAVRCAMFHCSPRVVLHNVEDGMNGFDCDVVHHVGVLYHLRDPVAHLYELGAIARCAIMLDTHFAKESEALESYASRGRTWKFRRHREGGPGDPFSGVFDHAKWLELSAIETILRDCGFGKLTRIEERAERHGPRILLLAEK